MSLADLVNVNITALTSSPTQPGFGTPLIAAYHTHYTDLARTYSSLSGLTGDGFSVTEPAYLAAQAILSQNPRVTNFMVGRRALPPTQSLKLTCTTATLGAIYQLNAGVAGGSKTAVVYTVASPTFTASTGVTLTFASSTHTITATGSGFSFIALGFAVGQTVTVAGTTSNNGSAGTISTLTATVMTFGSGIVNEGPLSSAATLTISSFSPTTSTIATAIAAQLGLITGVTASAASAIITMTATAGAGTLLDISGFAVNANFTFSDATADPGIATDLAAINAFNSTWYGLALDSNSALEIAAAAAWVESNQKLFPANNSDSAIATSATSDIASTLKTSAYARTGVLYCGQQLLSYGGAAWLGNRLQSTPGSDSWAYKTLAGVPADNLSENAYTYIESKNANAYTTVAGINCTLFGTSASGAFFDITRGIDWLQATIQVRVFTQLVQNSKIPYTDTGVGMITSTVRGACVDAAIAGLLVGSSIVVSAPLVATIAATSKASRNLPSVTFSAQLQGAIHTLTVTGTVTV